MGGAWVQARRVAGASVPKRRDPQAPGSEADASLGHLRQQGARPMHLSSPVLHEPPLSPGPAPAPPAPAPAVAAAPTPQPETRELSIEAQLVRLKLVSPDQIATAMREEAE